MKIKQFVLLLILTSVCTSMSAEPPTTTPPTGVPPQGVPALDAYLSSPSMVATGMALAPMRDFFKSAKPQLTRTPDTERNQAAFYSQAMSLYIKKIYNGQDYARHLSQDGRHVSEFLSLCNEFNLGTEQVYTGMRLFHNKFKDAELIDDTVLNHILEVLPSELEAHFPLSTSANKPSAKAPAKMVENMLLSSLTDHLTAPKTGNDQFFTGLSQQIASSLSKNSKDDSEMMRDRLRGMTIKFVEQLVSKTIWYPQHPESVWQSVQSAAHNIHLLCANGVINHMDDADDLMQSLISRFCFFLDQYGASLPISFYDQIEHDIEHHRVFFLESEELDEGVKPKKERLCEALCAARVKAMAYHNHGLSPAN